MILVLSWLFMLSGVVFFLAGSLGLVRFSDGYARLHAVTKADTLGLGLLVLGLALQSTWRESGLMLLIWLIVVISGAVSCHLLARFARQQEDNKPGEDS